MAISDTTTMSQDVSKDEDDHQHDLIMPGFRFHPTEEELIEFYLRRKVEGKRFNLELITFLDLYRYDPWELPTMAAIGEKEWYFYVPRDRKYRNGDRPNRVTTSGYWKATGADRTVKSEDFRSIGLKKTLVFYTGKAPKGIRTSWIMNEYRLHHHETERLQKAEISICRVYKRPGVQDHACLPRSLATRAASLSSSSSSRATTQSAPRKNTGEAIHTALERKLGAFVANTCGLEEIVSETSGISSIDAGSSLPLSKHEPYISLAPMACNPSLTASDSVADNSSILIHHIQSKQAACPVASDGSNNIFSGLHLAPYQTLGDDFHRLVNYQQDGSSNQQYHELPHLHPHPHPLLLNMLPRAFAVDKWWDSNPDPSKEFNNHVQIPKY